MSVALLRPIDTGGQLLPFLDYRIMQHEACIEDHFDRADSHMESAGRHLNNKEYGRAYDEMRKAEKLLRVAGKVFGAHKELKWVRQHPKFVSQ
jgi:hypothetical protein